MPSLKDTILFLEDDYETHPRTFDRQLQSIIHQPGFSGVKGILIGRFEKNAANKNMTPVTREIITEIIATKKELKNLPVIANVDFGHTQPMITFPIGGTVRMKASNKGAEIVITKH